MSDEQAISDEMIAACLMASEGRAINVEREKGSYAWRQAEKGLLAAFAVDEADTVAKVDAEIDTTREAADGWFKRTLHRQSDR